MTFVRLLVVTALLLRGAGARYIAAAQKKQPPTDHDRRPGEPPKLV
jgi:hypothetical protein